MRMWYAIVAVTYLGQSICGSFKLSMYWLGNGPSDLRLPCRDRA